MVPGKKPSLAKVKERAIVEMGGACRTCEVEHEFIVTFGSCLKQTVNHAKVRVSCYADIRQPKNKLKRPFKKGTFKECPLYIRMRRRG